MNFRWPRRRRSITGKSSDLHNRLNSWTHWIWSTIQQSRLSNRYWLLGLIMCYVGEIGGNSVALLIGSPVIVSSMGIISVIVCTLAEDRNVQPGSASPGVHVNRKLRWRGYLWIVAGVIALVINSSPMSNKPPSLTASTNSTNIEDDLPWTDRTLSEEEWVSYMTQSSLLPVVVCSGIVAVIGIMKITMNISVPVSRRHSVPTDHTHIHWFVLVSSLFAGITMLTGKAFGAYVRAYLNSSTDPTIRSTTATHDAHTSAFFLFLTLITAIACQEIFKQQAITRFPVSQFFPLFYAAYNAIVVIGSLIVFQDLTPQNGNLVPKSIRSTHQDTMIDAHLQSDGERHRSVLLWVMIGLGLLMRGVQLLRASVSPKLLVKVDSPLEEQVTIGTFHSHDRHHGPGKFQ